MYLLMLLLMVLLSPTLNVKRLYVRKSCAGHRGKVCLTLTHLYLNEAAEQAKRAYLAGGDYNESDVPAIVDMLNRGREFQQSDTYTPPEQIYTDLGANSPLAGLKYEMDGASEDEQAQTFAQYADRLSIERGIAEDLKEKQAIAEAENARRIAGDAMDEDVVMEQG